MVLLAHPRIQGIPKKCSVVYTGIKALSNECLRFEYQRCLRTVLLTRSTAAEHDHDNGHHDTFDIASAIANSP